jgi:hypothetical protein
VGAHEPGPRQTSAFIDPFAPTYTGDKDAALKVLKELAPEKVQDALMKARKSKEAGIRKWATDQLTKLDEKK